MKINLTIDRFEEEKVVLISDEGEEIIWPKGSFPKDAKEGDVLAFAIRSDVEEKEEKKKLAKEILNEILNP